MFNRAELVAGCVVRRTCVSSAGVPGKPDSISGYACVHVCVRVRGVRSRAGAAVCRVHGVSRRGRGGVRT